MALNIEERLGQIELDRVRWEGERLKANKELDDAQRAKNDEAAEAAKSKLTTAGFNLDQIRQEHDRLNEKLRQEKEPPGDKTREEAEKQDREKADHARKEDQDKTEAAAKAQADKDFFEKQEAEKKAFEEKQAREQKEFLDKQEQEKKDFAAKQDHDRQWHDNSTIEKGATFAGAALKVLDVALDVQEAVGQVLEAVVPPIIFKEARYIKDQAIEAFAEAGHEIGMAIGNPVNQKEAGKFLEEKSQGLKDFMADEMFQAAPAEKKIEWLEHKFEELKREEEKKFGERDDSLGIREVVHGGLDDMKKELLDAAKAEKAIQDKVNKEVEMQKEALEITTKRLQGNGEDGKVDKLQENQRKLEQEARQKAEADCKAIWDKAQEEMEKAKAQAREDASRQDAERRKKADHDMKEIYHLR